MSRARIARAAARLDEQLQRHEWGDRATIAEQTAELLGLISHEDEDGNVTYETPDGECLQDEYRAVDAWCAAFRGKAKLL